MRAKLGREYGGTQVFEQTPLRDEITHVGNFVKRDGFSCQQGRGESVQSGVFCSADLDLSIERPAAAY